jgi:hypothetical protein
MRQHERLQLIAALHWLKPPGPWDANEAEIGARLTPRPSFFFAITPSSEFAARKDCPSHDGEGQLDDTRPAAPGPITALVLMHRAKRASFFLDLIAKMRRRQRNRRSNLAPIEHNPRFLVGLKRHLQIT